MIFHLKTLGNVRESVSIYTRCGHTMSSDTAGVNILLDQAGSKIPTSVAGGVVADVKRMA